MKEMEGVVLTSVRGPSLELVRSLGCKSEGSSVSRWPSRPVSSGSVALSPRSLLHPNQVGVLCPMNALQCLSLVLTAYICSVILFCRDLPISLM